MSERVTRTPPINEETAPFWEATREDRLLLKRCRSCELFHWYPRTKCPECHADDTEWVESAGRGTIYSHSTMRRAQAPYTLAYVTLDEGVTILTNLVDCVPDALRIGQRVRVVFRETEDGVKVPDFTPDVSEDRSPP